MKKLFALLLALICVFAFIACTPKNEESVTPEVTTDPATTVEPSTSTGMADGVYTAQYSEEYAASEAGHGWQDILVVTYKDGVIVEASYDCKNVESGLMKSAATAEEYPMEILPADWIPQLNANIVAAGSSANIDGIAGATHSSDTVRFLLSIIETQGVAGEVITQDPPAAA